MPADETTTCPECGALVGVPARHADWHKTESERVDARISEAFGEAASALQREMRTRFGLSR
jgi:hypothetical protein